MPVVGAVECRAFRNLAEARTEIAASVVVVHGPNGAGKTNLLEAVYFGLTGRSFRTGNDRDLIRYGEDGARVELELAEGGSLLAALDRSGERRHLLSGRPLAGGPGERPLVSVFHPDRLQLVKGAPAHRRGAPRSSLRRDLAGPRRSPPSVRPDARPAQRARRPRSRRPRQSRFAALLG